MVFNVNPHLMNMSKLIHTYGNQKKINYNCLDVPVLSLREALIHTQQLNGSYLMFICLGMSENGVASPACHV